MQGQTGTLADLLVLVLQNPSQLESFTGRIKIHGWLKEQLGLEVVTA